MTRGRLASILLALLAGIAVALLVYPRWRDARTLQALLSHDEATRQQTWLRLLTPEDPRASAARRLLDDISAHLPDAPDPVLLDAADALRQARLWSWEYQPLELLFREARLRAEAHDPSQQMLAVESMRCVPLDAPADRVMPIFNLLLRNSSIDVRFEVFEAAAAWSGPRRVEHLHHLAIPAAREDLLALRERAGEIAVLLMTPPRDASLRAAADARFPPGSVGDEHDDPTRRDEVTLNLYGLSREDFLEEFLTAPAAAVDGSVYTTVLLAESSLPRNEAIGLAAHWIRSFDDDQKRAGALLAALLDAHRDLLRKAYEIEDVGSVRTTQRLALWALGNPVGEDDPREFAHRTLHPATADFNPDAALAMLAAGQHDALELLVTWPPATAEPSAEALQKRSWLIERFLPHWCTLAAQSLPAPAGGRSDLSDSPVLSPDLLFPRLQVMWMLSQRRLCFDAARKAFHLELE